MHFKTTEDLYSSTEGWSRRDYYACWRTLSHIVDHAQSSDAYRRELQSLDVVRLNDAALVFLKLHLDDVPACYSLLAEDAAARVRTAAPLDPPVRLSDEPAGIPDYEAMGVLL